MWLATLAMAAILGQKADLAPEALVDTLGASRFAERKAAEEQLEQIGRRALPALQKGLESKDPEVRAKSAFLINRIETGLLTKATAIMLDVDNATLAEIAESISEQSGMKIRLNADNPRGPQPPRISIHEPKPLPFWKALDRLCREGRLAYAVTNGIAAGGREQGLILMRANTTPTTPVFDSGPFRLTLLGFHYQRDVSFPPTPLNANPAIGANPPSTRTTESFFAQIQIAAEPRLGLAQVGQVMVLEAVDEKGQSLRIEPVQGTPGRAQFSIFTGMSSGSMATLQAAMTHPANIGKTLKTFKGVIPVTVSTRQPNPLVMPLSAPAGTTVKNDQTELTLNEAKIQPTDRPQTIQLTLRTKTQESDAPLQKAFSTRTRDPLQKVEVYDTKGDLIPSFAGFISPETGRTTITLSPRNGSVPKELRYFETARTSTEVSFEFSDVPMP